MDLTRLQKLGIIKILEDLHHYNDFIKNGKIFFSKFGDSVTTMLIENSDGSKYQYTLSKDENINPKDVYEFRYVYDEFEIDCIESRK